MRKVAIRNAKDFPRRTGLIRRLIIKASNGLVEDIYTRIVQDRRRWVPIKGKARTWKEIMDQAVKEGIITEEEAALLLDDPDEAAA